MEMEEENVVVPRLDIKCDGPRLFMIASFDGNCYLIDRESGYIYWSVPTSGFLRIANRGEGVADYADLKDGDFKSQLYHFKPNRPKPQLIPLDGEDQLKEYFNEHHKGGVATTDVSIRKTYYLINYQTGAIIRSFYSEDALQSNVLKNDDWLHLLIINRVDFYLQGSSPSWDLRFARIVAWFPGIRDDDNPAVNRANRAVNRTQCLVYHAPNPDRYINACVDYHLKRFPEGCAINRLIMENDSLSLKKIEAEKENEKLNKAISELRALITRNSKIVVEKFIRHGDSGSRFYNGKYVGIEALIEEAKTRSESDLRRIISTLHSSLYHPNILTFLGWQSDGQHDYFAYEKCPKTFWDYINEPKTKYVEMSEESIKIMSGLVCGISHLHRRRLAHTNLSLNNIWMTGDKTIKIGGAENSKLLWKTNTKDKGKNEDGKMKNEKLRINDLYEVGQTLLLYMTKGKHKPPSSKTSLSKAQFKCLNIQGTNREVLDLLQMLYVVDPVPKPGSIPSEEELCKHLTFWSASERLRYFQELSNYLDETPKPRPASLESLRNKLMSLNVGGNWSSVFKKGVFEAMKKVPARSGQPSTGQPSTGQPSTVNYITVNYIQTSPISLIRFTRNGYGHIQTFSTRETVPGRTLADDLGRNASEFEHTMRTYFPNFLFEVYAEVEKHFDHLPDVLKEYYPHRTV